MNQMNYHLIAIPNHRVSDHVRALANKHRYWDSTDWRDCQLQLYQFRYGISPFSHPPPFSRVRCNSVLRVRIASA